MAQLRQRQPRVYRLTPGRKRGGVTAHQAAKEGYRGEEKRGRGQEAGRGFLGQPKGKGGGGGGRWGTVGDGGGTGERPRRTRQENPEENEETDEWWEGQPETAMFNDATVHFRNIINRSQLSSAMMATRNSKKKPRTSHKTLPFSISSFSSSPIGPSDFLSFFPPP